MMAIIGRRKWKGPRTSALYLLSILLIQAGSAAISASVAMALDSRSLESGDLAPAFSLQSSEGKALSLADYRGKIVVLEWFNAGCPFVMKHYSTHSMQKLQKRYSDKGVVWLTINSTNAQHRDFLDAAAANAFRSANGVSAGTYLIDASGEVGKRYGAKTTPHFFVIDTEGRLAYQGAIDDDSDTGSNPADARNYVAEALDLLMVGKPITVAKTTPYGCSVKYAL